MAKAAIQFFRGVNEPVVPDIRLTRSRDGRTGQATFRFEQPAAIAPETMGDITGMWMVDEEGEMVTREVNGKFVNGKPQAIPGHNMGIATLGALILWIGWYGFNPGSVLGMDETVAYVAVTTTLAAAGGAIGATVISTITSGKPDLTMIINGILAGLVSITAGCGNMTMVGSWVAGLVGGIIVVFAVSALDAAGIDDPVGAFSVHGVCGVWGTLVVGLWGVDGATGIGLFNGGGFSQLGVQALGCAAYAIWTLVTCFIAWSVIGALFGGIRVTEQEEIEGLDIGEHGMEAYPDFATTNS